MSKAVNALRRIYVDQTSGSDSNPGTIGLPLASVGEAVLNRLKFYGGTIFLHAPEEDPYEGSFGISSARPITIRPWDCPRWHVVGGSGTGFGLRAVGAGLVTLHKGHVIGQVNAAIRCGDTGLTTGRLAAYDTHAEGAQIGWQTAGTWQTMDLHRCTGLGDTNDGFNIHGDPGCLGVASLYDCIGNDCGDEGASPHDDTILNIYGGEFRRNGSAGMTAVNNAVCNIYRSQTTGEPALFDGNGAALGEGHSGVAYYGGTCSGEIDGAVMSNNTGPGLLITSAGTVTLTDYTSTGNTEPDIIP